jgi:hypothetical protein
MLAAGASVVSADSTGEKIPAEEIGLGDRIKRLLNRGRIEEARELMLNNDVRHSISHQSVPIREGGDDDSVSTEQVYTNNADVTCTLVKLDVGDRWFASGSMTHPGDSKPSLRDYATVDDGSVLYWDNSHWTSANPTSTNINLWSYGDHSISFDKYRAAGCSAKVDLFDWATKQISVNHSTELYKSYSGTHVPIAYEYIHTRAATSLGSLSIGFGPLSVSVNNGKVSWRANTAAFP